ncbi:hypothetical protein B0H14DRAFT_2649829 [Mycena olivaceomarginata]|nr:hypothetical protein B0H14DRAFT_2649829 [Mycena olivaceomarginata]
MCLKNDVSIVTDSDLSYTEHDSETNDSEPEATSQSLQADFDDIAMRRVAGSFRPLPLPPCTRTLCAPDDPPLPSPHPDSGLLLSFDHDDGVEFEMAAEAARPAAPVNFHDTQPPPSSAALLSAPTTEELLQLLRTNRLNCRANAVNYWELQCYQCSSWISTSIDAVRQLQSPGQMKTLEQHMRSKTCQREARKPASGASFSVPRSSLGSPTDYSPLSPSGSVPPWSPQSLAGSPPLSPEMDSPLLPHPAYDSQRKRCERFSSALPELPPLFHEQNTDRPGFGGACTGLDVDWPPELSFRLTFPFHCVSLLGDDGDLPFELEIHERGRLVTVWSKKCRQQTTPYSPHCEECDSLHGRLKELATIARDAKKGTNYKFLSHDQL